MTPAPRIVSLLPSATEIACALGFEEQIVGRSHECDWPAAMGALPKLTSTRIEKGLGSRAIDDRVQAIVGSGLSVYAVDAPALRSLEPRVILTQTQCAVCAVTPDDLVESLNAWTGTEPALVSLAPDDLNDMWGDFERVAAALGVPERAGPVVAGLKARLAALSARVAPLPRPKVVAIEWLDPLMAAGNWVPELIEVAGGDPLIAAPGQHSPWLEWDALHAADPDVIVLMPCGFQIEQCIADMGAIDGKPEWQDLRAVREGRVAIADGHHFFNRPGPRLVESAEILAEIFHGSAAGVAHEGRGWRSLADVGQAV